MKKMISLIILFFSFNVLSAPINHVANLNDDLYNELIDFLFEEASSLSNYTMYPRDHRPPIIKKTKEQMQKQVCPDDPNNCYNLAAFYDTDKNEIVYDEMLDIDNNNDNSFIVHEIVHSLQFYHNGDSIFKDCESTKATELEAYTVQNKYLKKMGVFAQYGEALRFLICDGTN
ncbi:MAG: hypothetical protein KDD45_00760 [Bdellovibrionales bacterium]|nr:hypothetical protein [Bdellovibrionales bacterium]